MKKGFLKKIALFAALVLSTASILGVSAFADEIGGFSAYWLDDDEYVRDNIYGYLATNMPDAKIYVGECTYAYTEIYTNSSEYCLEVKWIADDSSIASVEGNGKKCKVNGLKEGKTSIISILYMEGVEVDREAVVVSVYNKNNGNGGNNNGSSVQGIQLNNHNISLNQGDTYGLSAYVYPETASDRGVRYSSNNTDVARVGEYDGVVEAVGPGSATITATTIQNGCKDTCNVSVSGYTYNVAPSAAAIFPSSATLAVGQKQTLSATVYPYNARNQQVVWNSNNPAVAVVEQNGTVTALREGTAVITATTVDGGKVATAGINVHNECANSSASVVTGINTRSADLNFKVITEIINCEKNGTVHIDANTPMSYDKNVAIALSGRPDVTLEADFPLNGYHMNLKLPAGFNLAAQLDSSGYAEWTSLCQAKGAVVTIKK